MTKVSYDRDRMRRDMASLGWAGVDLARAADVSQPTVSAFLNGNRKSPRTAAKLAAALGYSVRRYILPRKAA
jgi:transcriptional regulator with XRE-family HTH domain